MPTLLDLPDEILCMIAHEIPDGRRVDLHRLAASSCRLYNVLSPIVFSQVTLCDALKSPQIRHVSYFLHAIVRNPHLASFVESLQVHCWETVEDPGQGQPEEKLLSWREGDFEYDAELIRPLVDEEAWVCARTDEETRHWHEDVESGITDAWLALLIPRLRRLRKIHLVWPYEAGYVSLMFAVEAQEAAAAAAAASKIGEADIMFARLEEASGSWYDTENGASSSLMRPFFKFPAMRKIEGYALTGHEDDYDPAPDRSSGINHIDVRMSGCWDELLCWIQYCKTLKSFRYTHGGATVADESFQPYLLRRCLLDFHKDTLESIWIQPDHDTNMRFDEAEFVGSFAKFTALKHLHVGIVHLTDLYGDWDARTPNIKNLFPPSLESLVLCGCPRELFDWAIEQLENLIRSGSMSNLKTLALERDELDYVEYFDVNKLLPLKKLCAEAGVSFTCDM